MASYQWLGPLYINKLQQTCLEAPGSICLALIRNTKLNSIGLKLQMYLILLKSRQFCVISLYVKDP